MPQIALEVRQHGAGPDVDVEQQLADAAAGRKRRAQAPADRRARMIWIPGDADARVRVPLVVQRDRLDCRGPFCVENPEQWRTAPDEGGMPGGGDRHRRGGRERDAAQPAGRGGGRERDCPGAREDRHPEHSGRTIGPVEHEDEEHTSGRRPREIRGIQTADRARKARQRQTDHDAADHERDRDDGIREDDRVDRDDRRVDAKGDAELGHEAEHQRYRERNGGDRKPIVDAIGWKQTRREIDEQRSRRHPEHRQRQRDEREVIQHRHAEDPREQDLVHQSSEGDEEEADVGSGTGGQGEIIAGDWGLGTGDWGLGLVGIRDRGSGSGIGDRGSGTQPTAPMWISELTFE